MDVQALDFPDDHFDAAAAAFVSCSVPGPVQAMKAFARVVGPGGQALPLKPVRPNRALAGGLMGATPLALRLEGANINRRAADNRRMAGMAPEPAEDTAATGLAKPIRARPQKESTP